MPNVTRSADVFALPLIEATVKAITDEIANIPLLIENFDKITELFTHFQIRDTMGPTQYTIAMREDVFLSYDNEHQLLEAYSDRSSRTGALYSLQELERLNNDEFNQIVNFGKANICRVMTSEGAFVFINITDERVQVKLDQLATNSIN